MKKNLKEKVIKYMQNTVQNWTKHTDILFIVED